MAYITARIRPDKVFHGYDEDLQIVTTKFEGGDFVEKVIKIDRILSFTEAYIFIECPHDTVQTWEYEGGLGYIKESLRAAGLLIA
ncbi:hypothetical protein [uncultured Bosea sp.]|uniref:hypothetical protein n=1 Tax=uncultured Bosea sp. TaxID=211457 RepID=UPI0025F27EA7|nr:hypothetical protein [uncultured Bosea sp.]